MVDANRCPNSGDGGQLLVVILGSEVEAGSKAKGTIPNIHSCHSLTHVNSGGGRRNVKTARHLDYSDLPRSCSARPAVPIG
ncbi:hypothetical protein BN874_840025 [Candidatus Contendobacter odensis Run_B_J11]|uniref:Uncharacterized protein n=1 Tax=Candidatus Contendobacter odensis Run_B_J11 TaxID=1400861 RepID=A0A7U7J687_9GAMM|nr:hypothetical protein BN874_840025 [Candidatus Contendobacter odensis Run_B_J11]